MESSEYINEEERVPSIAGRRIDMFDMMAALQHSSNPDEQIYEIWELSEERVEAAVRYIEENEEELLALQERLTLDS